MIQRFSPEKVPSDHSVLSEFIRVLQLEGQAILDCALRLQSPQHSALLEKVIELMNQSLEKGGKIIVTGVGKSGKVGQKIAATLSSTGSLAVFLHPTEGLHGDLGILTSKDVVLALSQTGNTEELIRLLPSIHALRIPIIAITGHAQSQLAQKSTVWLDSSIEQEACPHNLAPTTSTTLALALGDAIAVTLMRVRGFDARSFAQNHPGGALGKRLHAKVADVMHTGSAVPTVQASASMDEVLIACTQKGLGAVLVTEDKKLLGLITDGDIRRALKHREKFFQMEAHSIMTKTPVTISSEDLAFHALELMENRPSQIHVLPVVTPSGDWVGLIRLHDLVKLF